MSINEYYGYEFDLMEPNHDDFSSEDYNKLYEGNELRTACCQQVVPYDCSISQCNHGLSDLYYKMVDANDLSMAPTCLEYIENGYVFHTECTEERRSVTTFILDQVTNMAELIKAEKMDEPEAQAIIDKMKGAHHEHKIIMQSTFDRILGYGPKVGPLPADGGTRCRINPTS